MPATLKKGATGDAVVLLQKCLNSYGYGLATDGSFGALTDTSWGSA